MAKSLAQLKKQIAALQRQADAIKKKEAQDVIARIKEAIAFYELTPAQLGFAGGTAGRKSRGRPPGRKARKAGRAAKPASKVKYRSEAGKGWSGHGRRPQWFLDALAAGKTPESMLA